MRGQRCFMLMIAVLLFATCAWAQGRVHAGRLGKSSHIGHQKSSPAGHLVGRLIPRGRSFSFAARRHRNPLLGQYSYSPYFHRRFGRRAYGHATSNQYAYSPYLYQPYGVPYSGFGAYGAPDYDSYYSYSPYFPYLYFYDLYYRESVRSTEEASRYEAALAREPSSRANAPQDALADPEETDSNPDASDLAPLAPRNVLLMLDGEEMVASPSGGPLVLGSGQHSLRISARPSPSSAPTLPSTQTD